MVRTRKLGKRYGRARGVVGEPLDDEERALVDHRLATLDPASLIPLNQFAAEHGIALRGRRG